MDRPLFLGPAVVLASVVIAGAARAEEPAAPSAPKSDAPAAQPCDGLPDWLPGADLVAGVGLMVPGVVLFHRSSPTGANPTIPAWLTGVGAGAVLSGGALLADRKRCDASVEPGYPRRSQMAVAIAGAGTGALAIGVSGLFMTLGRDKSPEGGAYAIGGGLIALSAAATTMAVHIVLAPRSGDGPHVSAGIVPTNGGAAGTLGGTF